MRPHYDVRDALWRASRHAAGRRVVDTVDDADTHGDEKREGTGFVFDDTTVQSLTTCIRRATAWYLDPDAWMRLQCRAMKRDFGWERSAIRYLKIYTELLCKHHGADIQIEENSQAALYG
jgi:starch synthase